MGGTRCFVLSVFVALVVSAGAALPSHAAEPLPAQVWVIHHDSALRSGPADDAYPTERVTTGDQLHVYRRQPDGWLAVRPLAASFSLVAARHLSRSTRQAHVAQVTSDFAVAWIGSNVGDVADHRWQIRLRPGETVRVLEEQTLRPYPGVAEEPHVRIAPPAGEFRWIHEREVTWQDPAEPTVATVAAEPEESVTEQEVPAADAIRQPASIVDPFVRRAQFESAPLAENNAAAPRDGFVERSTSPPPQQPATARPGPLQPGVSQPGVSQPGPLQPTLPELLSNDPAEEPASGQESSVADLALRSRVNPDPRPTADDSTVAARLKTLDLQLSLAVAEPPARWKFTALRREVQQLLEAGGTTLERGRAKRLLERIDEFAALQERFAETGLTAADSTDDRTGAAPNATAAAADAKGRFDGTGWLLPVTSSNGSNPPFALLDRDGNILQFVSPMPGLNLSRYVKQEIGIVGQRRYDPQLNKPHLTAHRVVNLRRHTR